MSKSPHLFLNLAQPITPVIIFFHSGILLSRVGNVKNKTKPEAVTKTSLFAVKIFKGVRSKRENGRVSDFEFRPSFELPTECGPLGRLKHYLCVCSKEIIVFIKPATECESQISVV